jgi:hypothetical protein
VDDGASWTVSNSPYGRLNLTTGTIVTIPTLGEWGLISLAILMLGLGVFFIKQRMV